MKWLMVMVVAVASVGLSALPGRAGQADDKKAATTIAGKWHFVLNTEGGDRDIDANFEQNGKQVTGKFGKDDAKGTFDDGKLQLEFSLNSQEAGPGKMKIKGDLANDAMTGNWDFQTYNGTFKATRVP